MSILLRVTAVKNITMIRNTQLDVLADQGQEVLTDLALLRVRCADEKAPLPKLTSSSRFTSRCWSSISV